MVDIRSQGAFLQTDGEVKGTAALGLEIGPIRNGQCCLVIEPHRRLSDDSR